MTQTKQPKTGSFTPGAIRAALDIYADMYGVEAATLAPGEMTTKWAKLIDRQTKAPEMYEFLARAIDRPLGYDEQVSKLRSDARRIKAAIDGEG